MERDRVEEPDRRKLVRATTRLLEFSEHLIALRAAECIPILELMLKASALGTATTTDDADEIFRWRAISVATDLALRRIRTTEATVCAACGSAEVHGIGWIELNLGTEAGGDPGPGENYCDGCGAEDPELRTIAWASVRSLPPISSDPSPPPEPPDIVDS